MNMMQYNESTPDQDYSQMNNMQAMENELQHFFKINTHLKIETHFKKIDGPIEGQFSYLDTTLNVIENIDVDAVQILALLDAVRPAVFEKLNAIMSCFAGKTLSKKSSSYAIRLNAFKLLTRLSTTYDIVINKVKKSGQAQPVFIGSAIHRALSDKSRLVLADIQLHQDVPEDTWKSINNLYLIAQNFNITSQAISDMPVFQNRSLTIKQVYSYIMLLASAETNRLSTDEIFALSEFLKDWIMDVHVSNKNNTENDVLCMDPCTFLTPKFSSIIPLTFANEVMYFDFDRLKLKLFRSSILQSFVNGKRFTLSQLTINKIVSSWTVYAHRYPERMLRNDHVYASTCIGMAPELFLQLPDAKSFPDTSKTTTDFRNRTLKLFSLDSCVEYAALEKIKNESQTVLKPEILDYSEAGYCLQWEQDALPLLSIMEIVVIHDEMYQCCKLGQIVWIKNIPGLTVVRTGISILSSVTIPVLIRPLNQTSASENTAALKGFILEQSINNRKSYSILIETTKLAMGQICEVMHGDKVYDIQLLESHNQHSKYQVFNIAFYEC